MKKIILITLSTLFALSSFAQKHDVAPVKALEIKAPAKTPVKAPELKAPSLDNLRDPQKAMDIAKKQDKIVVYHFTGSTWCPPCMQLDAKVITNKEFIAYANKNIAYVNMNNNRREFTDKEYNATYEKLAINYAIRSFPTLLLINPKNNNVSAIVGYSGAPASEIIRQIEAFKTAKPRR